MYLGGQKCSKAAKREKSFKFLKRTVTTEAVIDYQKKRVYVKKVIKNTKKTAWQSFCNTIGRETEINAVCHMIKKMNEIDSYRKILVKEEGGMESISNKDKITMLAQTFAKAHSIENLDDALLTRQEQIMSIYGSTCKMMSLII